MVYTIIDHRRWCTLRRTQLWFAVILMAIASAGYLSFYLHHPDTKPPFDLFGLKYSDVNYGLFSARFTQGNSHNWFNRTRYELFLSGEYRCPAPYIDYKFEYPPLIGLFWYVTTCSAFMLDWSNAMEINYSFQAGILLLFYAVLSYTCFMVIKHFKNEEDPNIDYRRLLILASPTFVVFLIYNWDVIAASFALLGVLCYLKRKYFLSGLFLGLSISTKILTAGIALYMIVKLVLYGRKRDLLMLTVGLIATGIVPFVILYIASPHGFSYFLRHLAEWYCENCLYLPFVRDIFSRLHRHLFFSITTAGLFLFLTIMLPWRNISMRTELEYLLLAVLVLVVFNYVFSPQMMIMISPLALLVLNNTWLLLYMIADISNVFLIICFFFELHTGGSPWSFGSTTQYFGLIRNLSLLVITLYLLLHIADEKLKHVMRENHVF